MNAPLLNPVTAGPDPIDVAVGARLRLSRRMRSVSQAQLADALGVSFQQVQKYEKGANRISASMLVRAAGALQTPAAWLLGEAAEGAAPPPVMDEELLQLLDSHHGQTLLVAAAALEPERLRALLRVAVALAPDTEV